MTTTLRIGEPARVGEFGLTVDRTSAPAETVLVRYSDKGRRHSEPFVVVARLAYSDSVETLRDTVVGAGVPVGTATQLVSQLASRLASPRAQAADLGFRPVR